MLQFVLAISHLSFQYDFSCSQEEGIHSINTKGQVNDGKEYVVHVR